MTRDEIIDKGVRAALKLAETEKWGTLSLAAIAQEAGLTLKDFHGIADKDDLTAAVETLFDAGMSEGSIDPDETARTRLFDVIMMRFEAMEEVRDGALSYLRWRDRSLEGLTLRIKARAASARWALACAGLDGSSKIPRGVQIASMGWVFSKAERAWRQEMSEDLSQTMAALDAELIKLEERIEWLQSRGRARRTSDPADAQ